MKMEHWEFLLQKEGDRAQLPLEVSNVEILEGRYQIVARSSLIDTKIKIQISHSNQDGVAEQHQECFQKTNSEGLILVVPFTYLQPGLWRLTCLLDEVGNLPNTWQQTVQLQVLDQDLDVSEAWDSIRQEQLPKPTVDLLKKVAPTAGLSQDATYQVAASLNPDAVTSDIPRQKKAVSLRLPDFTHQADSPGLKTSEGRVPQISKSHAAGVRKSPELPAIPSQVNPVAMQMVRSYLAKVNLQPTATPNNQPLLVEAAFEALKLNERFRSMLNTLARKPEEGAWESSDTSQHLADPEAMDAEPMELDASQPIPIDLNQPQESEPQINTANDIAIQTPSQDEALLVSTPEQPSPANSQPLIASGLGTESEILPPDLVLPEAELVMGQLIMVHVTLSNPSAAMYVKLWINDRQTRTLLDGPRWLIEFVPSQMGVMEALTRLMVPLGSLEISFEAIAVDMQTKRESHKTSVNRLVMPLGLPLIDDANT